MNVSVLIVSILIFNILEAKAVECPYKWKPFEGNCYLHLEKRGIWEDQNQRCQKKGGNLTSVHSQAEENFIFNDLCKTQCLPWIGMQNQAGKKVWTDGTPMDFQNWKYSRELIPVFA